MPLQLRRPTIVRNALNLHRHTLGQLLDGDAAAGRLVRKVLLEDAVHLGEVGHVVEENIDLKSSVSGVVVLPYSRGLDGEGRREGCAVVGMLCNVP
jgi:hypothetical protein